MRVSWGHALHLHSRKNGAVTRKPPNASTILRSSASSGSPYTSAARGSKRLSSLTRVLISPAITRSLADLDPMASISSRCCRRSSISCTMASASAPVCPPSGPLGSFFWAPRAGPSSGRPARRLRTFFIRSASFILASCSDGKTLSGTPVISVGKLFPPLYAHISPKRSFSTSPTGLVCAGRYASRRINTSSTSSLITPPLRLRSTKSMRLKVGRCLNLCGTLTFFSSEKDRVVVRGSTW
mmetsp:Transcript_30417/g.61922  ORF Transcript_30417/g.61922 Transcript_30417/m.61922 type:complete len:240 (-) Transcript_30417:188-907(-)